MCRSTGSTPPRGHRGGLGRAAARTRYSGARGVLRGEWRPRRRPDPALHRCCPSGSIFWPWIGKQYRPGGVCFLTLNLNVSDKDPTSVIVECQIASDVIDCFQAGDRTPFGSRFFWHMLCTASAVLASLDDERPVEEPGSESEAIVALERIARVQAVKCAPIGDSSNPTGEMVRNCPSRFALPELELLRPGVVVAFGDDAWNALLALAPPEFQWCESGRFHRGTAALPTGNVELLWLNHPSSRGPEWSEGQTALVTSLREKPLGSAPPEPLT